MRSVLITQAIVALFAALAGYIGAGDRGAFAGLWGAATALANGLLLNWRLRQAQRPGHTDALRHLGRFYFSAVERLLVVSVLLALGLGVLKLNALAVLLAFIAGQLALIIAGSLSRKY